MNTPKSESAINNSLFQAVGLVLYDDMNLHTNLRLETVNFMEENADKFIDTNKVCWRKISKCIERPFC